MEWPKITLFGDSITRRSSDVDNGCWGSMINFKVGSYFDVDPRGFEGYNSKWGFELMPKLFPRSYLAKVELFVVFFGHNDAWEQPPTHQPVEDFDKNMRNIVKYLVDNGLDRSKILLITPAWFYLEDFLLLMKQMGMPPVKKELDDCERYSETVKKIGRDEQVEVLDFFTVTASYQPLEELFCDGVHFSRKGAKLLYDHLMPVVERKLEATFKKPLADLWHAVPFDQHPEVKPLIEAYQGAQKAAGEK